MAAKYSAGLLVITLLLVLDPQEAAAQKLQPRISPPARPPFHQYEWGPLSHPTYVDVEPHHSSTEFEGAARGMGYLYRGYGAGFRDWSEGQVHLAIARRIGLENQREWFYLRYEAKDLNAGYRTANRDRRATPEEMARRAKALRPAPLSEKELAADGTIQWPAILLDQRHDGSRKSIDAAMQRLVTESDLARGTQTRHRLIAQCESMRAELRERIAEMPANEYISGVKFLDSLRCELKHPSSMTGREDLARR